MKTTKNVWNKMFLSGILATAFVATLALGILFAGCSDGSVDYTPHAGTRADPIPVTLSFKSDAHEEEVITEDEFDELHSRELKYSKEDEVDYTRYCLKDETYIFGWHQSGVSKSYYKKAAPTPLTPDQETELLAVLGLTGFLVESRHEDTFSGWLVVLYDKNPDGSQGARHYDVNFGIPFRVRDKSSVPPTDTFYTNTNT
jgi:hypothetical protein